MLTRLIDRHQSRVLAARYLDVILADRVFCAVLVGLPTFVAVLISIIWKGERSDAKLHFFLSLSCIWFGCFNACREMVKEQAIFRRERMVNLKLIPYSLSKMRVLSLVAVVQCVLLILVIRHYVNVNINAILLFVVLVLTQIAGTSLGLAISSVTNSQNTAVAVAVMATIPQMLFSEFFLGQLAKGTSQKIEAVMISKWSFDCLQELTEREIDNWAIATDLFVLCLFIVGFYVLTLVFLKGRES